MAVDRVQVEPGRPRCQLAVAHTVTSFGLLGYKVQWHTDTLHWQRTLISVAVIMYAPRAAHGS